MTHPAAVAPAFVFAPAISLAPSDPATAILAVAQALQPDLAQGFHIDALRLRLEMERAFGGSDAAGLWDWKLAYEAGEVALVLFLRKFGRALLAPAGSPGALLPILAKVSGLLPTHTRRSEAMERSNNSARLCRRGSRHLRPHGSPPTIWSFARLPSRKPAEVPAPAKPARHGLALDAIVRAQTPWKFSSAPGHRLEHRAIF